MKTKITLIMVVVLLFGTSQLLAIEYTITDLGTLGSDPQSIAFGINDAGQVVGYSGMVQGPEAGRRAFLWDDINGIQNLGTLGGDHSEAYDINNLGQIVGRSSLAIGEDEVRGFIWENGLMSPLEILGGHWGEAHGINDSGQIVGTSSITGGERNAVIWDNDTVTLLGTLGGPYSNASSINESGQVVGWSDIDGTGHRAYIWEDGMMTELNSLSGNWIAAYDINDLGQIVGECDYAFLLEDGDVTNLGDGWANAINGVGQIIGTFGLWENGVTTALTDLLPPESGWSALSGYDINNAGQIVGSGLINDKRHAFLLTPIPEPTALCLLVLGIPALQKRKNRRTVDR